MEQVEQVPRYWFPAKRYGWGWGLPVVWQGWAVYATYFAALVTAPLAINYFAPNSLLYWLAPGIVTLPFVMVCWLKGEPPRWQWGK